MLFGKPILEPVACVTHELMVEVAMMILQPNSIMSILVETLVRIILERLPLGTLFPISTTASTIFTKSITEASRHKLRTISPIYWRNLTREEFVCRNLILERVSYLMTDG